ncbi:uncharacterized protein N7484_009963 [Penicillium longicatenatum]|uniref:uncharacterized protein n=1 Tax=Penicillium longicatenatum TaxID=1561947 RepID=UPI002549811A|nr:uncharacterized protein N7484_009963 [Penicillium longicatenatum]KAJ5636650.1 hypothetical protein N7484_009963 [Penicillium longicatenatum]
MHILGLANGTLNGNSEILLKAALIAAEKADSSITTSWIHVPSVSVPRNPRPLEGAQDVSMGTIGQTGVDGDTVLDDRRDVLNAILTADALIFATPIYSHQPAGTLKALADRILGPFTDAAFVQRVLDHQKAGEQIYQHIKVDSRILKPRIAAFIAVGGSPFKEQVTMALPTLHQFVYSLHAKVVDQHVFQGYGRPGSVLLRGGEAVIRAEELGRNVASQIGKTFDEAEYFGPKDPASCPYCHMSKVEIDYTEDNDVGCITCGARGRLVIGENGRIQPVWEADSTTSCITFKGKLQHLDDLRDAAMQEGPAMDADSIKEERERWAQVNIAKVPLTSHSRDILQQN